MSEIENHLDQLFDEQLLFDLSEFSPKELKQAFTPAHASIIKKSEVDTICREHKLSPERRVWADEAYEKFKYDLEKNSGSKMIDIHLSKITYQIYKSKVAEYIDLKQNDFLKSGYEETIKTFRKNEQEALIAQAVTWRLTRKPTPVPRKPKINLDSVIAAGYALLAQSELEKKKNGTGS